MRGRAEVVHSADFGVVPGPDVDVDREWGAAECESGFIKLPLTSLEKSGGYKKKKTYFLYMTFMTYSSWLTCSFS